MGGGWGCFCVWVGGVAFVCVCVLICCDFRGGGGFTWGGGGCLCVCVRTFVCCSFGRG